MASRLTKRGVPHRKAAPTVALDGVWADYPGSRPNGTSRHAVEDVSFEVQRGSRVAVVGPNGAGKSTLFRLIAGTLKPSNGTVQVFGHGPDGHICIGYVPQRNQIDWAFPVTVEDVVMMGRVGQIGFFRWPRRKDWQQVRHELERVDALHLAGRQIGELSGGQQQRVFIARALAQEAELILLDEPMTGLDVPSRDKLFAVLDRLDEDGVTVMVATHDLDLAAEEFDQVLLINHRVVAYGEPGEVLSAGNLVQAYGGHLHVVEDREALLLTGGCDDEPGSLGA